ncbi:hypothetical protein [Phenylobacterium sp.]|uniref:hypothetical protein n=1 Tax=Phenylobacterium sp. TaxID=1871053 RepID=UPI0027325D5B|nr:hypothetical protein [Phenylobacterium sp.]MDP3854657.1 hypothetical protein [Phenylobacterium sp.]
MSVDLASLVTAAKSLDGLTVAATQTAAATDRLRTAQGRLVSEARKVSGAADALKFRIDALRGALDPLSAAQRKLDDEMRQATSLYRTATNAASDYAKATAGLDARLATASSAQAAMAGHHAAGAKAARLHAGELAKLAFGLAGVGAAAAAGTNPIAGLIQLGPQLVDIFATAKAEGIGFSAAMRGLGAALAPMMAGLLPIVAVVGVATAAFALFEGEVDKHTKGATTWGDTWQATVNVVGKAIMEGPIGDGLRWLDETFGKVLDSIVNGTMSYLDRYVGLWGATFEIIIKHWRQFPQVMGAIIVGFANGTIQNVEGLINASISAINRLTSLVGWKAIAKIDLPEIKQANNALAVDFERTRARIEASFRASREGVFSNIVGEADRLSSARKGPEAKAATTPGSETDQAAAAGRRAAALDEEAEASKRATETAEIYLASLSKETAEHRRSAAAMKESAVAMKEKEIAAARAGAPTLELKLAIGEQGDYAVGQMRGTEAIKEINAPLITIPNPDFEGAALTDLIDELQAIDGLAADAAAGLESAFGRMGRAIGGITTATTGYRAEWAALAKAYEGGDINFDERVRKEASLRVGSYIEMASAAKGFFEESSAGYKLLEGAEKAYRIVQFGLALASITMKGAETAATVGSEVTQTAATAAGTAARTPMKMSEAVSTIFAQLGVFAFPVVAAAVAVMVAAGASAFGGGGGGGKPGATDMEDRQKAQGSGSVLGDAAAKSESIAKALEMVAANTNIDLEYSNEMLKALRSIDSQIGTVAAALARSLGAGGALSTDRLNLGTTGRPATLGNLGFGKTTTRSLQDQGLSFGSQSLSEILAGGIQGQTFQQVLETRVKKAFGITYSNKSSSTTTTGALDGNLSRQITQVIGSLKNGVLEAAKVLGVTGAEATLDAFKVNLGKLSFKDMNGAEIQEALNGIFGKLGDDLAATAIPSLRELAKVGEGAFETLARVARGYQVVDVSLRAIGTEFGAVGVASLAARERLVDLVGGLDAFTEQTAYFAETFLTDVERMAPVQKAVTEELRRLGLAGITTKDQFKSLVLGLDLSTAAGAELYAALMAVAPAFANVIDFAADGSQAVQDAREALSAAYERESDAIRGVMDRFKSLADGLRKFSADLSGNSIAGLSPTEQYAQTRREFLGLAASAATGDPDAMGDLQGVSQAFLEASKATSATLFDYQRDLATVRNAVRAAEVSAREQVSVAEQQLSALNASVAGLITINDSVLSVRDAIAALRAVEAAALAPTLPPTPPPVPTAIPPPAPPSAARASDWASYVTHYPDVAAEYWRNANDKKGRRYLAELGIANLDQFAEWHWNEFGKAGGLTPYANGGIFTNGIVSQPTSFHNSQMGEGGDAEAIMPLVRGPRGLAVRAYGQNDNAETVKEVRDLKGEIAKLNAALISIATTNAEMARGQRRWSGEGIPVRGVDPDSPIEVAVA